MIALTCHRFGEDIHNLESCENVWEGNNLMIKYFANKMTIDFNVLGLLMEDRIDGNLDGTRVASMKRIGMCLGKIKFIEKTTKPDDFRTSI